MVDKHFQGPEFFNQLAPQWDATRNKRPEVLQKLVAKLGLTEQDQVWDLGSGTGVLLPYLAPKVQHVMSVDYADKMLALAQENGLAACGNRIGSMSTLFFTAGPVSDYASAMKSDAPLYGAFWREMLKRAGSL